MSVDEFSLKSYANAAVEAVEGGYGIPPQVIDGLFVALGGRPPVQVPGIQFSPEAMLLYLACLMLRAR